MKKKSLGIEEISESIELYDAKPKKVCVMFVYFVFSIIVVILIASSFIGIEQYTKVQGQIDNINEEITIVTSKAGVIEKVNVKNGQCVKKGDIIISLENDNTKNDYKYYKDKLDNINDKKAMLYTYIMFLKGNKLQWENYTGNKYYHEFTSRKKILEKQCKNLQDDEKCIIIETEISKLYLEKQDYENQYSEIKNILDKEESEIEKLNITSPVDGKIVLDDMVFENNVVSEGQNISTITVKNKKNYSINAYVEETDIVNLKKGMKIKFALCAYPTKKYGYIEGKISSISDKAISSEMDGKKYYLLEIEVSNLHEFNKNKDVEVKSGMSGTVKILTSKKKLIRIALEKLNVIE